MEIKNYNPKYKEQIQQVCINTGPIEASTNIKVRETILNTYCNYYIEQEPENSFALVDENDDAQGYIFSAPDFKKYRKGIKPYLKKVKETAGLGILEAYAELIGTGFFSIRYPAHMHIDINEGFRGNGNGSAMVNTLFEHLRSKGVKGVMLIVGTGNKRGINFYKKNGFHKLFITKDGTIMGRKL